MNLARNILLEREELEHLTKLHVYATMKARGQLENMELATFLHVTTLTWTPEGDANVILNER